MTARTSLVLAGILCLVSVVASADSITSIPITGSASKGFSQTDGDFSFTGPGLFLDQATPQGSFSIGSCTVGAVCQFSFSLPSTAEFCMYCLGLTEGSLGNKTVQFLDPLLSLTGSAYYSGESSLSVPLILVGTITGYELVNCDPAGSNCSLGPKEFTLHIVAKGTGQISFLPDGTYPALITGMTINLTGTATTVPEPISLVLTGTGLAGVWIRRKVARPK